MSGNSLPGNWLEIQILTPTPDLQTLKLQGWSPVRVYDQALHPTLMLNWRTADAEK